jgi:hypothetical protein
VRGDSEVDREIVGLREKLAGLEARHGQCQVAGFRVEGGSGEAVDGLVRDFIAKTLNG